MPSVITSVLNKMGEQPENTALVSNLNVFSNMERKRQWFFDVISQENSELANKLRDEIELRLERIGDIKSLALHTMRGAQRLVSPNPSQLSTHPDSISMLGGGCVANWLISEVLAHRLYEYSHLSLNNAYTNYVVCELIHLDGRKELHVVTEIGYEEEGEPKRLIIDPLNDVGPIDYETWSSTDLYINGNLGKIHGSGKPIPLIDLG